KERTEDNPWPQWPMILTTSSSHEEGVERRWAILTKEFLGDSRGRLQGLKVVDIRWGRGSNGKMAFDEIPGTERVMPCELALLAIGFVGAEKGLLLSELGVELDARGNIKTGNYVSTREGVFAAGDIRSEERRVGAEWTGRLWR